MEELIKDILLKKELKGLDKKLVEDFLNDFFKKNEKIKKKLEYKQFNKRSEEYKQTLKDVRKKLREIYGVFIDENYSKRDELLKELKKGNEEEKIKEILKLHTSTNERLPYYNLIYSEIFKITGKGNTIIDLACGLNPLSYLFLDYKPKYIASDISSENLEFIDTFFKKMKITGQTIQIDLIREQEKLTKLNADICFILKASDTLETQKKNITRQLIEIINAKWFVISFPKKSLGGKKTINQSKRQWFFNFLKYTVYKYDTFETENEFFFVIKK